MCTRLEVINRRNQYSRAALFAEAVKQGAKLDAPTAPEQFVINQAAEPWVAVSKRSENVHCLSCPARRCVATSAFSQNKAAPSSKQPPWPLQAGPRVVFTAGPLHCSIGYCIALSIHTQCVQGMTAGTEGANTTHECSPACLQHGFSTSTACRARWRGPEWPPGSPPGMLPAPRWWPRSAWQQAFRGSRQRHMQRCWQGPGTPWRRLAGAGRSACCMYW